FAAANRNLSNAEATSYEDLFQKTVSGVENYYGSLAFKIFERDMTSVSEFNAALFDAEMLSVSKLALTKPLPSAAKQKQFISRIGDLFYDEEFMKSITRATSDVRQIQHRVKAVADLMKEFL